MCPIRPIVLLAVLMVIARPLLAGAAGCEATADPMAVAPPEPAELEALGARIGSIEVEVEDIFDPSKPEESALPYRLANDLHPRTRPEAIRSQLLFDESEPYSQQKIEETERLLRGRRYLYDAWIEPTCYHPDEQMVDVEVRVRDVWSFNPGFSFSRKGGSNRAGIGIEDQDFLGRGKSVSVSWGTNVDRTSLVFEYDDPQLFGSWWRTRAAYSDNSDGSFTNLELHRPFYSLDTRWSAGTAVASGDRVTSRYQLGHVLDQFTERLDRFEVSGGRSDGLRDGWARRWLGGVRYERSEFGLVPGEDLVAGLPEDRTLAYPWVGMEWVEDDFATARNQDQLARTEDLEYGRFLHADLGLAAPAWGADRTAALFTLDARAGRRFDETKSVFVSGGATGRLAGGGAEDTRLLGEARYYQRQSPGALLFANVRAEGAIEPDLDHQLTLGGDNGLRGYPLRYQSGTGSLLLTAEERFYTDWYPFHLFHIGAAVFADAGRTWGRDVAGEPSLGWLGDVGAGLRIGNTRTGLGNVLHIDLAVPLARQPGIDSVQLLIETRRSF